MTETEYLTREDAADLKSEFFDGVLYPLYDPYGRPAERPGAPIRHNLIKSNLIGELGRRLCGGPWRSYSSDMRTRLAGGFAYPDLVMVCGEPADDPAGGDMVLPDPHILIEVLSPSTEGYDRGFKAEQYRRSPTVQEVVFVAQDAPRVERYTRQPDGTWLLTVFADPAGDMALASVPVRVPLADVYRGVRLPTAPPSMGE